MASLLPAGAPRGRCGRDHVVLDGVRAASSGRATAAPRPGTRPKAFPTPPLLKPGTRRRGFSARAVHDETEPASSRWVDPPPFPGSKNVPSELGSDRRVLPVELASFAPSTAEAVAEAVATTEVSSSDDDKHDDKQSGTSYEDDTQKPRAHDDAGDTQKTQIPFVPDPSLLIHCEPVGVGGNKKLKIALLLSGGVDSSVALTLLKSAGHDVTAFYLQIWFQEDFRNYWANCPWEDDLVVAQGVCDVLGVTLKVVPLTNAYWDLVVTHSIDEIAKGRTPNPDVLCNSRVKFGAFREFLATEFPGEFDRVASGHYAAMDRSTVADSDTSTVASVDASTDDRTVASTSTVTSTSTDARTYASVDTSTSGLENPTRQTRTRKLVLSGDPRKDQTYFLAHLSQKQLRDLTFPIGGLPKHKLREVAHAANLPNADRPDSQGICFLGKVKFSEFVAEHLGEVSGSIIELETGQKLGTHAGFWFHTIGQRQGLGLSGGPWYVARKDVGGNVVYVTKDNKGVDKSRSTFSVGEFNWISGEVPFSDENGWVLGAVGDDGDDASSEQKVLHPPMAVPDDFDLTAPKPGSNALSSDICEISEKARAAAKASRLFVKVRHGENRYGCTVKLDETGATGVVVIDRDDQGLAAGQFAVFYHENVCLGCGVISEREVPGWLIERDQEHRQVIQGGVRRIAEEKRKERAVRVE